MDNHATTPVDPRVLDGDVALFHRAFWQCREQKPSFRLGSEAAVDTAREQVGKVDRRSSPREIVFTSGATESDNLAIKGVADAYRDKGNHIVTCVTEHKAVLDSCKVLRSMASR